MLRLHVGDLDNNGALISLLVSSTPVASDGKCPPQCTAGALVWLSEEKGSFKPRKRRWPSSDTYDQNGDGRLDLVVV